jgi:hypothetical protein
MKLPVSLAAIALLVPCSAIASPCDGGFFTGPVALGFEDGAAARPRRACIANEIFAGGGGSLIYAPSSFYGNVRAEGALGASLILVDRLEVFGEVEVLRYQTVISSLSADHVGLGFSAIGATYVIDYGAVSIASLTARASLPTAFGLYLDTWPIALDVGGSLQTALSDEITVHAYGGLVGSIAAGRGPKEPRAGALLDAGASWHPLTWFGVAIDIEGESLYRSALDHLALAAAFRFLGGDLPGIELMVKAPVAGSERTLAAALLDVSYRF